MINHQIALQNNTGHSHNSVDNRPKFDLNPGIIPATIMQLRVRLCHFFGPQNGGDWNK